MIQNQYPKEFDELKRKQSSMSWFVDGETGNKPLTDFVDTYLKEWVGYMEESIFEINKPLIPPSISMSDGIDYHAFIDYEDGSDSYII